MVTLNRGIFVKHPGSRSHAWAQLQYTAIGGSGGNGGYDSATPPHVGYPGKQINGTITSNLSDTLVIDVGGGGSIGVSSRGGAPGGQGGVSAVGYSGGSGGYAGYGGSSGGGGGGGAATVIVLNGTVTAVAGGGAGGGGAGNGPVGLPTQGYVSNGTTYGGNGENKGGDGGGGGGGGGGYYGGVGGSTVGGDSGAYSGSDGASWSIDNAVQSDSSNPPSSAGSVVISYTSLNGKPYYTGGKITTVANSDSSAQITHTFTQSGRLVGLGPLVESLAWQEVLLPKVKVAGDWEKISTIYTKKAGVWEKLFPSNGSIDYTQPGIYSWQVPPGIYSISVTTIGGGGGGGGGYPGSDAGGGGGSGGVLQNQTMAVVPGETLKIVVGQAGQGSVGPGQAGTSTSITGSLGSVIASGGQGGLNGNAPPPVFDSSNGSYNDYGGGGGGGAGEGGGDGGSGE